MSFDAEPAALGGVRILETLPDDTFYGFRLNPATGSLRVEIISGDSGGVVALPQEGMLDANDYRQWLWTTNTLDFKFSASNNGHLEMKVM